MTGERGFMQAGDTYIVEYDDGPYLNTLLWVSGLSNGGTSESIPGPRTRRQQERWEYREAERAKEAKREQDWERQWTAATEQVREVYHLIMECIDAAVPDANGTDEFVVLEFAKSVDTWVGGGVA